MTVLVEFACEHCGFLGVQVSSLRQTRHLPQKNVSFDLDVFSLSDLYQKGKLVEDDQFSRIFGISRSCSNILVIGVNWHHICNSEVWA